MKEAMPRIVGNDTLKTRLCRDIASGTLPHACILEGARGTGRHTIARMAAAALACSSADDPDKPLPCLDCPSCRKIMEKKSPDVILIGSEGKTTVGVEAIRFLKEDVHILPNDLEHKIYIIEDADRMTVQAQNAFLLTLEEPPAYVHFFLLAENAGSLLETVRSRAPVLRTEPLPPEAVDAWLCANDRRAAQMKLASPKEYNILLRASGHGIGQALGFLDPKTFAPVLERRRLAEDLVTAAVKRGGAHTILPILSRFSQKRDILQEQLNCVSDALRDLLLLKKSEYAPLIFYTDEQEAAPLYDSVSLQFLYRFQQAVSDATEDNSRNANVRLLLLKLASRAALI